MGKRWILEQLGEKSLRPKNENRGGESTSININFCFNVR